MWTIAVLFIPIPSGVYKDGGTREYTALTYKIVKWNRLTGDSTYDKLCVYLFPNNFRSIGSLWTREKDKVEHSFRAFEKAILKRDIKFYDMHGNLIIGE